MKQLTFIAIAIPFGVAVWWFGNKLSADAIALAFGLVGGILAGLPTALLLYLAGRRRDRFDDARDYDHDRYQPPPVVVYLPAPPQQLPAPQTTHYNYYAAAPGDVWQPPSAQVRALPVRVVER